jgi:type VI secretion system protein ImpK
MTRNPFSEPEDDRTIIRPNPGGRRAIATERTLAPASPGAAVASPPPVYPVGSNLLAAIAEPLILLLARLLTAPGKPFSGDLRDSTIRALGVFEQRAREAGIPTDQVRPAHYALCASIDDVVSNTPWGSAMGWNAAPLTATFHQEARSGERFFDLLAQYCRSPGTWLPVIELMYVCLSLGFMGPYRRQPDGVAMLDRTRQQTHETILRARPPMGPELSPNWTGVAAPYRPSQARLPLWVIGSATLAIVAGLFIWCMVRLNTHSDDLYARMLDAPPSGMPQIIRAAIVRPLPPVPRPPESTAMDRLRVALQPDIDRHSLDVLGTDGSIVVRISARALFPPASATFEPGAVQWLDHVGTAMKQAMGQAGGLAGVQVNGYTDNQPIRTVKFPSNFRLSAGRADAVREVLQRAIGTSPRVVAEGRAGADPIETNTTAEGREQNRRIEIVLRRQP